MKAELNIFMQALAAIAECWRYYFGFVAAICVLETVAVLYDLGTALTIGRALVESGIFFYLCATMMGLDLKDKEINKKYGGFMFRYIMLLYLPVLVISLLVVFSAMSVSPADSQGQGGVLAVTVLAAGAVAFVTTFLFGTVFPAHLRRVGTGIGAAVARSFRQAAYLLPRLLFGSGAVTGLGMFILIFSENVGIGSDAITATGSPNVPGGVVLLLAKLVSGYSLAVFSVIVCRAYLKDLEERGESPVAEADVFA